jgi:hypothetical protein
MLPHGFFHPFAYILRNIRELEQNVFPEILPYGPFWPQFAQSITGRLDEQNNTGIHRIESLLLSIFRIIGDRTSLAEHAD